MKCKKCNGKGLRPPTEKDGICYYNCEMGGDCSSIKGWTKKDCKTCGWVNCEKCNGTGKIVL